MGAVCAIAVSACDTPSAEFRDLPAPHRQCPVSDFAFIPKASRSVRAQNYCAASTIRDRLLLAT
jgi:hypothetical protein